MMSSPLRLTVHDALFDCDANGRTNNTSCSDVSNDLLECGVALLKLQENYGCVPKAAFAVSIEALDLLAHAEVETKEGKPSRCRLIEASADSAHATGYHRAGCLSARYNAYREGFVFSDGHLFDVQGCESFQSECARFQGQLHAVADRVLDIVGQHLELPLGWFQENLGPTRESSQWHIKRYVNVRSGVQTERPELSPTSVSEPAMEWLPTHTDPSLISVVFLNRPGVQEGSSGLQYVTNNTHYVDVPFSGHEVAIIFVGSVLQHLTGGYFRSCRHRVLHTHTAHERVAATLFVRPAADRILRLLPSPVLKRLNYRVKGNLSFAQWNAKVARNYERAQQRSGAS
jgi:2OG-Fe(II) oxygenase superfamily